MLLGNVGGCCLCSEWMFFCMLGFEKFMNLSVSDVLKVGLVVCS